MIRASGLSLVFFLAALLSGNGGALGNDAIGESQVRIEMLWPHAGAPISQAERANLLLYTVEFDGHRLAAICNAQAPRGLIAINSDPARWLEIGKLERTSKVAKDGRPFPAWEYQEIDVSLAKRPENRLYFTIPLRLVIDTSAKILITRAWTNVWAHAQDARTYFPLQDVPLGVDATGESVTDPENRDVVDAKIEIVWPHEGASVTEADKVNVTAMLFRHGTLYSVPPDFDTTVTLLAGLNQAVLKPVAQGQKRVVTAKGIIYPVWDFDDIDVSAAKDPRNKYFFMLSVGSYYPGQSRVRGFFSNIWVHGADGRTYFPQMDVPDQGCP